MPLESLGATTPESLSPRPAKRSLATLPGLCLSIPEVQLHKDADDREHPSKYLRRERSAIIIPKVALTVAWFLAEGALTIA